MLLSPVCLYMSLSFFNILSALCGLVLSLDLAHDVMAYRNVGSVGVGFVFG